MSEHTTLRQGERNELTAALVSRRVIDCEGTLVRRLLVTDERGNRLTLLVAPGADQLVDLGTGRRYRLDGVVGSAPPPAATGGPTCPACGEALRRGTAADAFDPAISRAVERLDVTETFGVVTADTTTTEAGSDGDGWRPMRERRDHVDTPDYVCPDCGERVGRHRLGPGANGTGDERLLQNVLESAPADGALDQTVGLATGGAKDVTNFRENVAAGYTPRPGAITPEGLFDEYYFETGGIRPETDALFAPTYAPAVSDHPLDGTTERYLAVGLDSTLAVEDFERPRLDLVVALDVSQSMDSPFDEYYYDESDRPRGSDDEQTTKLAAATASLCALTEQLRPDDRLGVVLYNHRAHVAKPLSPVGRTNMAAIRGHIRDLTAGGGTNVADGFEAAVDLLADGRTDGDVERRVVFMTDMMPNTGTTGTGELERLFADAADDGIHTTFVGMGLDANPDLVDTLSGVRGANHYFVDSAAEFERRLGDEFDYTVTPLVYDLGLELTGEGSRVEAVHGSPTADAATGRLVHVETLFPSPKSEAETRGGVILVQVDQVDPDASLSLVATWQERDGSEHQVSVDVDLPAEPETFAHDGVRKAVALARYARELRAWTRDVHDRNDDDWLFPDRFGEHERKSTALCVPPRFAERFARLRSYLAAERDRFGDDALERELALLDDLCNRSGAPMTPSGGTSREEQ